ncbi:MAG: hypothetical protein GYA31_03025 [Parcubacteria group bacterium]|nr:hypothetical protein [Parcubacteria group bacterium]
MVNSETDFIKERVFLKKEQLAQEGLPIPEDKELISETITEKIEESLKNYPPTAEIQKSIPTPTTPAPVTVSSENIDVQASQKIVEELVNIALTENIPKAVTMALKTGNAYLIDKLHDTLVDKYFEEFKKKNII